MSENDGKCALNPDGNRVREETQDSLPIIQEMCRQGALDKVDTLFTYQRPTDADVTAMSSIRDKAKELAVVIINNINIRRRDAVRAIDLIRAAVMSANASIVLRGTEIL